MKFTENVVVISDTSPLIALQKVNRIDLLGKLFGYILIPEEVATELCGKNGEYREQAEKILSSGFISVIKVLDSEAVEKLMKYNKIHKGESEAIVLAKTANADLIIIDDASAKLVATEKENLKATGSVGIVIKALNEGFVSGEDVLRIVNTWDHDPNVYIGKKYLRLLKQEASRFLGAPVLKKETINEEFSRFLKVSVLDRSLANRNLEFKAKNRDSLE